MTDLYRRVRRRVRHLGKRVHRTRRARREIKLAFSLGAEKAATVFALLTLCNPFAVGAAAIVGTVGDWVRATQARRQA